MKKDLNTGNKRYWWVHHESEAIDFVNTEEELEMMLHTGHVEHISEEEAEKLIREGFYFEMKRLLD